MHALLSTLFGAFLALAVYGLSFIPTSILNQGDDFEDVLNPPSDTSERDKS
jgi:hypothetical protein